MLLREADYLPLSLRLDHGIEVARAFQPVMALMGGGRLENDPRAMGWKADASASMKP